MATELDSALRVVVVDDSTHLRSRLTHALGDLDGVTIVGEAENATGGLHQIMTQRPDLLVVDLRMPGGGGLQVLEELHRRDSGPAVLVLTNYPYAAYRRRCAELGARWFFDKATELSKVKQVVLEFADETRRRNSDPVLKRINDV